MDTFGPITGHFREHMLLLAALQRWMHVHIPTNGIKREPGEGRVGATEQKQEQESAAELLP